MKKNTSRYSRRTYRERETDVIVEDTSQITNCPKCKGILKWGDDNRLEDKVFCISCGWRPTAKVPMEL